MIWPSTERLILASQSPRRRKLLEDAGYVFEAIAPAAHVEDGVAPLGSVDLTVVSLAQAKARAVAQSVEHGVVLAADTLVECAGVALGKPFDRAHAREMLQQLSSRTHRVVTGVVLHDAQSHCEVSHLAISVLSMAPLDPQGIEEYLDSGEWVGKAGAFGYQDGWEWLTLESGSAANVVGLPVECLPDLFNRLHALIAANPATTADARPLLDKDHTSPTP